MTPLLIDDLKRDEGLRLTAYEDTVGIWTVGYGHAHVAPGTVWTEDQADGQLHIDIATAVASLDRALRWWRTLNDVRQDALCEMAFNMGTATLCEFHHALSALQIGDYDTASAQFLLSKWAAQVGMRATRLAAMIKTGAR